MIRSLMWAVAVAVSAAGSAVSRVALVLPFPPEHPATGRPGWWRQVVEAPALLAANRVVRAAMGALAAAIVFTAVFTVAEVFYVRATLSATPLEYGLVTTAFVAGTAADVGVACAEDRAAAPTPHSGRGRTGHGRGPGRRRPVRIAPRRGDRVRRRGRGELAPGLGHHGAHRDARAARGERPRVRRDGLGQQRGDDVRHAARRAGGRRRRCGWGIGPCRRRHRGGDGGGSSGAAGPRPRTARGWCRQDAVDTPARAGGWSPERRTAAELVGGVSLRSGRC